MQSAVNEGFGRAASRSLCAGFLIAASVTGWAQISTFTPTRFSELVKKLCGLRNSLQSFPNRHRRAGDQEVPMKRWFTAAVLAAIIAVLSPSVSAQWPLHPQPGVPKGPDGKANLNAPVPRTAEGKPDLSGIWIRFDDPEPNGAAGRPPLVRGGNAGAGFKDGLPFQP